MNPPLEEYRHGSGSPSVQSAPNAVEPRSRMPRVGMPPLVALLPPPPQLHASPSHMRPPNQDLPSVILVILVLADRGEPSRHYVYFAAQIIACLLLQLAPLHLPFVASNLPGLNPTPGSSIVTRPLLSSQCLSLIHI